VEVCSKKKTHLPRSKQGGCLGGLPDRVPVVVKKRRGPGRVLSEGGGAALGWRLDQVWKKTVRAPRRLKVDCQGIA